MAIVNKVGSIVEGENFFGRIKELERAWELIKDGNTLKLAAPRRVGKSSFAKKMIDIAKNENWSVIYLDLEKTNSEEVFITQFIDKLKDEKWYEKAGAKFTEILESIKVTVPGTENSIGFQIHKQTIFEKLEKALNYSQDTLIVVDELTVFLNNLQRGKNSTELEDVKFFLNWLRGLRQVPGNKIRWIFCSSISIESFANRHNLSHAINDLTHFKIDELKGEEPTQFVKALSDSAKMDFSDHHILCLLNKLNWYLPYFIQILFKEIVDSIKINGDTLSENTIDEAYQRLINSSYFDTWHERLNDYDEDKVHVHAILKKISGIAGGMSRKSLHTLLYSKVNNADKVEEILTRLLTRLQNEGYLILIDDKYTFRSPILRDFWYKRFVK